LISSCFIVDEIDVGSASELSIATSIHNVADKVRQQTGVEMAKKATNKAVKTVSKKRARVQYTTADVRELRAHSKAKTPVSKIAKAMKRSEGSLRQKALKLDIRLGHRR
jgi:hypothetical protein